MKNKYQRIAISILLVAALILSMPGTAKAKGKVKLNKTRMSVTIGNTVDLRVKNTTKKVKWSSSNKKVASVNSYGEVTGKKAGTAKITAKVGKKKLTCNVTVPTQNISNKSIYIQVGEKQKLDVYGVAGSDSVFWGSDYERIATVTQSGEITAKSIGTTSVYAVINSGVGKTYSCEVVVYDRSSSGDIIMATPRPVWTPSPTASPSPTPRPTATPKPSYIAVTKVVLSQRSMSLAAGRTSRLTATIMPSDATNKALRWTSANTSVATVAADGTVTGVNAGSTVVYVTTTDGEFISICTVTVTGSVSPSPNPSVRPSASPTPRPSTSPSPNPSASPSAVPVTKVALSRKNLSTYVGRSDILTATVYPEGASNKNVTWTSADTSIVTVDSNGRVTAVAAGTTMVFVTTVDGEFVAVCTVTVQSNSTPTSEPPASSTAKPTEEPSAKPSTKPSTKPTEEPTETPSPKPSSVPSFALKESLELNTGEEDTIVASGKVPEAVTWESSDTTIATVDNGTVKAVNAGKVTITVKAGEEQLGTCNVTVYEKAELTYAADDSNKVTGYTNKDTATKVEIPEGKTEIGEGAFKDADKLWSIKLPDTVTTIGAEAFSGCTGLKSIEIPGDITIGAEAFSGCTGLESIVISNKATKIGTKAFANCTSLKSVRLPSGIAENIEDDAFEGCGDDFTVYGEEGSDVKDWATEHSIKFEAIRDESEEEESGA